MLLYLLLPYINLLSPANPSLKLTKPYVTLRRFGLLGVQNQSLAALPRSKWFSKTAAKKLFLCARMPCIAISLHISCQNHGTIRFPTVKLMIPGGHEPLLRPKIWAHAVQNCSLNHTCRHMGRLAGLPLLSRNAMLARLWSTGRHFGPCIAS